MRVGGCGRVSGRIKLGGGVSINNVLYFTHTLALVSSNV